jgi:hypothetical protein
MDDIPEAQVIKITSRPEKDDWVLHVQCPFCNMVHHHKEKLLLNRRLFGIRLSHCLGYGKQEYLLVRGCKIQEL